LWHLWGGDAASVEGGWRIDADHLLLQRRPEGMTRFDEGWWRLFGELAAARSPRWMLHLCRAMEAWSHAVVEWTRAGLARREQGLVPDVEQQLELRIATSGMHAVAYLLEDAYDYELPRAFHAHPTVCELKRLAGEIVGLGDDVLGFGCDLAQGKINL